jgi:hypothetical protein
MSTIFDPNYKQRLQLYVDVLSPDWTDNIVAFNQESSDSAPIQIISARIENSVDSYGKFDLLVRDTNSILKNRMIDHKYIMRFTAKKPFQNFYSNLQTSIVRKIQRLYEPASGERLYRIMGVGTGSILTHTLINYSLQSAFKNVITGENNLQNDDPEMLAPKHIERIFTDRKILPALNEGLTVQERGKFGLPGKINYDIKTYINSIDTFATTPSNLCRDIANSCACLFNIDEDNDVFFDRPLNRTLGHLITNTSDDMSLDANLTMMTEGEVTDESSTFAEDGYFDKLYAYSQQSSISQSNTSMGNYTSLHENNIAFRINKAGASKLWDLSFMLQKFGAGTDSNDPTNTYLHGLIVNDENYRIGGDIVGEFVIPVSQIPESAGWVKRINIRFRKDIEVDKAYWIVLMKIGNAPDNTIGWWHDDKKDYKNNLVWSAWRYSRGIAETPKTIQGGWDYSSTGPKYTYSFSQRTPLLQTSFAVNFNPLYETLAPVEKFESISWIKDQPTSMQYLAFVSQNASRTRRNIDLGPCSIPNVLPRIGYANVLHLKQKVNGVDEVSEYIFNNNSTKYDFEITGARYVEIKGDTYDLNIENIISEDEEELTYVCVD